MIYITNQHQSDFKIDASTHCYLDIETTGLSKHLDTIVCIGLAYFIDGTLTVSQWIIENPQEEALLISTFLQEIPKFKKIYTYGGKHFDWPFILEKAQLYDLDTTILTTFHLVDLKPSKTKRTTFEDLIGFKRQLTTSGRELAKLCKLFITTNAPQYKTLICEHNTEELRSILATSQYYKFLNHLKPELMDSYSFGAESFIFNLRPTDTYPYAFNYDENDCTVCYDPTTQLFSLSLNCLSLKLRAYLPARDYYLVDGALMHKSLARLLPASMRQKVSKSDCYLEQKGLYLPISLSGETIKWQDTSKQNYTFYNPDQLQDKIPEILKLGLKKIR